MKKILAALLAIAMLAALCGISVSAWSDAAEEANWTRHSIFDDTLVDLVNPDGTDHPIPTSYNNEDHDDFFQFFKDQGHLYEGRGLNVSNSAKISITFKGTGIKLCTAYRNNGGFDVSDIGATLDGTDVSSSLKDLIAPTDNNTEHTPILTLTGLTAGEHTVTLTCTNTSYRYSVDYFDIENEGKEETAPVVEDPKYNYYKGQTVEKSYPAIWQLDFAPTDITGAVSIKFDMWIEDVSRIKFDELEFGSLKATDWQEKAYNPATEKMGISNLKSGEWGTVTMNIADGADVNAEVEAVLKNVGDAPKGFDMTHFCRIRLFTLASYDKTLVKIKNIVAVKADGSEIVVGSDAPAPATFDAAASVAVIAVASMGVALVASKKRH